MSRTYSAIRHEMEEIEESFHIRAYVKMRELSLSLYTLEVNYQLLKQHLDSNNDMNYQLQFEYKPLKWQYHPLQKEVHRLLLNFVASAIALVDHNREIIKEVYSGLDFLKEVKNRISQDFEDSPVNKFIQDLRSYVLHNEFPSVGSQFQHRRISPLGDPENLVAVTIRLTFSKNELLESKWNWKKPAKKYLETQGDLIFLDALIDEYYSPIKDFYSWLNKRQLEMHESEYSLLLDQWEKLYQELNDAVSAQRLD